MSTEKRCPNCGGMEIEVFHRVSGAPTNTCIQLDSSAAAKAWPTGDIELGYCPSCEFVGNFAFDQQLTEYSGRYEETQGHSPTFNRFHESLAQGLIDRYDVRNKRVIEIGCGKGEFLQLLCEMGGNQGLGFDPGYDPDRYDTHGDLEIVRDFYSEAYSGRRGDLVCCKMTLEHIPQTKDFVDVIQRATIDPSTIIYFQVPNAQRIFTECAFEDIYYEHCSYFTSCSLDRLFRLAGFTVLRVSHEYDDQYLSLEAVPAESTPGAPGVPGETSDLKLKHHIKDFPERYRAKLAGWNRLVGEVLDGGGRIAVWGAGSKAATFLHALDRGSCIQAVVDINPHRHNHFMVGTAQEICGPEALVAAPPDLVIVMNRIYVDEVRSTLGEYGLQPKMQAL